MWFYVTAVVGVIWIIKRFNLLRHHPLNLEFNDYPFTTMDLHTINQNFNWPDYKGGFVYDEEENDYKKEV